MRWLTGAIADPAITPSHCRAPMISICWATRSNPPGCAPPAANSRSPSKTRDQRNAWCFMAFDPSPVSGCSWGGLSIAADRAAADLAQPELLADELFLPAGGRARDRAKHGSRRAACHRDVQDCAAQPDRPTVRILFR